MEIRIPASAFAVYAVGAGMYNHVMLSQYIWRHTYVHDIEIWHAKSTSVANVAYNINPHKNVVYSTHIRHYETSHIVIDMYIYVYLSMIIYVCMHVYSTPACRHLDEHVYMY